MAYCTVEDVRDILSGVTALKMSDIDVEKKISYVEGIINTYVAARYIVPFSPTPGLIKTICIDMSGYYVMRTLFTRDSVNRNEYIDDLLLKHLKTDNRTGTLYDIADGIISLVYEDGTLVPTSTNEIISNTQSYVPTFNVDNPINWRVDPDRLEDVAAEREN